MQCEDRRGGAPISSAGDSRPHLFPERARKLEQVRSRWVDSRPDQLKAGTGLQEVFALSWLCPRTGMFGSSPRSQVIQCRKLSRLK